MFVFILPQTHQNCKSPFVLKPIRFMFTNKNGVISFETTPRGI